MVKSTIKCQEICERENASRDAERGMFGRERQKEIVAKFYTNLLLTKIGMYGFQLLHK